LNFDSKHSSPIAKFLEKKGEGILSYDVEDIEKRG
jgi:hypothetical protein